MNGPKNKEPFGVSIVIPARNEAANIGACLRAVFDQDTGRMLEVLVIDSGSSDDTVETAAAFPGVRVLSIPPSDFGHGRTRNLGAEKTTGPFVVFLNADALPADRLWLEALIGAVEGDGGAAGAYSRHLPREGCDLYMERDLLRVMPPEKDAGSRARSWDLMRFSTVSCVIPRRIWETFPFDDAIDIAEDQDWARRILEEGHEIRYAPGSTVVHSHNYGMRELYRVKHRVGRCEDRFRNRFSACVLGLPLAVGGAAGRWLQDVPFILKRPLTFGGKLAEIGRAFRARAASFSGRFTGWLAAATRR
jgi:rhamnosyltransferase